MNHKGFTLIELIIVIVILGMLAVIALPKFINLQDDANQAVMLSMKGAIISAEKLISLEVYLNPKSLNNNQNRFTLDSGESISVRGKLADGRWNNTFSHLLDFKDTAQIASNNCNDISLKWCVRQRGVNWFTTRGYSSLGTGRGFAIFPYGKNVNLDRCYIYFLNQNGSATPTAVQPSVIGTDFTGC